MKKTKLLAFIMISIFLCSMSVWAEDDEDVWKPDEAFFVEHEAECIVENREYYANGPNGQVLIYENPISPVVIKTMENGEIILIEYTYTNEKGITWGFCESEGGYGWLPMPYMVHVYDYMDFEAEYGEKIVIESGTVLDDYVEDAPGAMSVKHEFLFLSNRCLKLWTYPGSSRSYAMLLAKNAMNIPKYSKTFVDEEGRTWGFIGYFSSEYINRWVCLGSVSELLAEFEELYPDGDAPVRDKREIAPYTGEEILPDVPADYIQEEKIEEMKELGIDVGMYVMAGAAILFSLIMWLKIRTA